MKKLLLTLNRLIPNGAIIPSITAFLSLTLITNADGQQIINAGPDQTLSTCGATTTLTASITPTQSSNAYTVSTVAYNPDPYNQGTLVSLADDEITSTAIQLPFSFCFYGNTYNQVFICSNNWIGFSAGQTPTWQTVSIPTNSGAAPKNAIMAPWQDINPASGGSVRYQVYGTAPFRRFVVSYSNVPMYLCTGMMYTSQIKIYETTNVIETHIANKPLCTNWNGGNAVHGLHNATGTQAVIVNGRNNTQWTVSAEGVRFTPASNNPNYTVEWLNENNSVVGIGTTISVTPSTSTFYQARITYNCPAVEFIDTVKVFTPGPAVDAGADMAACPGQQIQLGTPAQQGVNYVWQPAAGLTNTNQAQATLTTANTGNTSATYTYVLAASFGGQCYKYDTVQVSVKPAPIATFTTPVGQCLTGNNFTLNANGNFSSSAQFSWMVDNTPASQYGSSLNATFVTAGSHPVVLTVSDSGCVSNAYTDSLKVFDMPVVNFTATNVTGCMPLTTQFVDSSYAASGIMAYKWDFGVGSSNSSSPAFEFTQDGMYDVTLTVVSNDGCASTITMDNYVWAKPLPEANFAVSTTTVDAIYDPYVAITNLSNAQYYLYTWGDGQSTTSPYADHAYTTPGTYTITQVVKNGYGCKDSTSRTIVSKPSQTMFVPTAFTPNNDHMNETFVPQGLEVKNFNMDVYNRWGQLIFSSREMKNGWDGTYQGAMCEPGVYTYKITYLADKFEGGQEQKVVDGMVTLLR